MRGHAWAAACLAPIQSETMLSSDNLLRLVVRFRPCRSPPPPPSYKTEAGRPTDGAPVSRALEKE